MKLYVAERSLISRYGGMTVRRRRDLHTRRSSQFRASEVDMRVVMAVRTSNFGYETGGWRSTDYGSPPARGAMP